MQQLIKSLIVSGGLLSVFSWQNLQAQKANVHTTPPALRAWQHHFANQKFQPDLTKAPDLYDFFTGKRFPYFHQPQTVLFKKTLTQKKPAATHKFFGAVQLAWARQEGSQLLPSDDAASDIAVDHEGNVYVTGYITNQPFGKDYLTVKYDATGKKLWEVRYNGDDDNDDVATEMAVDRDGNIYVTGSSKTATQAANYITIKYNTNGGTEWMARYDSQNGAGESYDAASVLAIDDDFNVYVSGWSENDFATVKYNAAGVEQWSSRFSGSGNTEVSAIAVDQTGNVYLAGQINNTFTIIKYNSTGQEKWSDSYSEFAGSRGIATALAVNRRNEVYVTGMHEGLDRPQYLTMKFGPEGNREWRTFYRGQESCNWNIATALALDDSGGVYVTGESGTIQEICEDGACMTREDIGLATIKYSDAGIMQWSALHNPTDYCIHAATVQIDRYGNAVISGYDRQDFVALKYDRNGRQQWYNSFSSSATEDIATASFLDEIGNVYVTGFSIYQQDKNWITMKYNNAGVTQWAVQEKSPGNSHDVVNALALDNQGNVYIAGASQYATDLAPMPSIWTVIKYNGASEINWKQQGARADGFRNAAEQVVVDTEGNSYMIASRYDLRRLHEQDGVLAKYNREGKELWKVVFDSTAHDGYSRPSALCIDRQGNIYVTGASQRADFVTMKYDVSGQVLWQKFENPGTQSINGPAAITCDDSNNIYVAGITDGDAILIKYDAAGNKQWLTRYHGTEAITRIAGIELEPKGKNESICVLADIGFYADYLTLKYNHAGEQQWEVRYSRTIRSFDHPTALAMDDWGNVYVTGEAGTIKYDENGIILWSIAASAKALTVDDAGNLYTTGPAIDSSNVGNRVDFFTAKYNTHGALEWSAYYDGPGNSLDYPVAIALDQSRNIYVAGQSQSDISQPWSCFTTIKYTQNAVAVHEQKPQISRAFHLDQNFPNPFNPSTRIRYTLMQTSPVLLKIFDTLGGEIATLVQATKPAGEYEVQWTPDNLPGGIYIYRLQVGPAAGSRQRFVENRKLIYLP